MATRDDGGTKRGVEPIDAILRRWLKANQVKKRLDPASVYQRWVEVVGEEVALHTRVVDFRSGLLVVEVDSPPLLHDLATYYRREILESLRQKEGFPNVRDIRFRAGTFHEKRR